MSARWMESDNEDTAPSNSEIAHSYAEHIGHEYARLRARLHKLEKHTDVSADTNQLALSAFDRLAEQARAAEPHLTKEQAFSKVYSDPKNVNLRRLERNSAYASIGYDCRYEQPIAKSISPEESGHAYQAVMKLAEAAHRQDPSKTVAQHFEKIYCSNESLRRQDISERNVSKAGYPPVADTEPVICEGDGYAELCAMAEEFRANNPFISFAEAFARVGEANPELMMRERKERYQRMGL